MVSEVSSILTQKGCGKGREKGVHKTRYDDSYLGVLYPSSSNFHVVKFTLIR